MGLIIAIDRDGREYRLEGRERASLMEILRYGGLSLEALCGGCCLCATCHVYVDEEWMERVGSQSDAELSILESEFEPDMIQQNSRLACQIHWREYLNGLRLTVAPPS